MTGAAALIETSLTVTASVVLAFGKQAAAALGAFTVKYIMCSIVLYRAAVRILCALCRCTAYVLLAVSHETVAALGAKGMSACMSDLACGRTVASACRAVTTDVCHTKSIETLFAVRAGFVNIGVVVVVGNELFIATRTDIA